MAFSSIRLLVGIPCGSRHVRQRTYHRIRCWTARLPQVHWQGYPGCSLYFPPLERSTTPELGHGEMYVAYVLLNGHLLTWFLKFCLLREHTRLGMLF